MTKIRIEVNGQPVDTDVAPTTLLVELLRGPLAMTGTHQGCDTAQCGACTVLLDGQAVKSCSMLALQAQGRRVTTVEGLAHGDRPHPLQEAFMACHGLQCGFCTPGMLVRSYRLLIDNPNPSEDEIRAGISGNLCRCTGYQNIVKAILAAAAEGIETAADGSYAISRMSAAASRRRTIERPRPLPAGAGVSGVSALTTWASQTFSNSVRGFWLVAI